MTRIILMLLLTACANSANAQVPAAQDQIACYNVITGRVFSAIECGLLVCRGTDGSGKQFSGNQVRYGGVSGPAFVREPMAKRTMRFCVISVLASWKAEESLSKLFHRRIARKRMWNSGNA